MFQEDRLRRLGDRRDGKWLSTVVDNGPFWSANVPLRPPVPSLSGAFDVPSAGPAEQHIETPLTVHALLLLYTQDEDAAEAWVGQVQSQLTSDSVRIVHTLELLLNVEQGDVEHGGFGREHFGFADGLSQPLPYDADDKDTKGKAVLVGDQPATKDRVQGVPLGEFLIGYVNGHHENAPGPVVADCAKSCAAGLPAASQAEGFRDLGLNGSYLVARELKQDVAAFWRSMEENAAILRARDPSAQHIDGAWLAARVIGRDRDGHLLCPGDTRLPACTDRSPDSSFLFYDRDAAATGCPAGSHVRRAFPRDALTPTPENPAKPASEESKQTMLQAANNHRILRRGRKFGPKLEDQLKDDDANRGLLFMCLNTDIDRQFEFVQQTWLLNSSFATLFQEVDPLVGPAGLMTIRDAPLRRIAHVDTFVRMAGGDYFFLPSLPALRFLASL